MTIILSHLSSVVGFTFQPSGLLERTEHRHGKLTARCIDVHSNAHFLLPQAERTPVPQSGHESNKNTIAPRILLHKDHYYSKSIAAAIAARAWKLLHSRRRYNFMRTLAYTLLSEVIFTETTSKILSRPT